MSELDEFFGEGFEDKMKRIRRTPRFSLTEERLKEIAKLVKEKMTPENPALHYQLENHEYHVILVQAPRVIRTKQLQYSIAVGLLYAGGWVSATMTETQVEKLEPNKWYIAIGRMKQNVRSGRLFYNFRTDEIIPLEELKKHVE